MPVAKTAAGDAPRARVGALPIVGTRRLPSYFTLELSAAGHFHRREGLVKLLQRYDAAGSLDINTVAATAFQFNTEERRDTDFFGAIGSFPARLTVTKGGIYRVTYRINTGQGGAVAGSARSYARKNGSGGEITGSHGRGGAIATATFPASLGSEFVIDLAANDYLEIMTIRVVGTGTMPSVAAQSHALLEMVTYDGEAALGGKAMTQEIGTLRRARLIKGTSGSSGTTAVDVKKNGVSILPSTKLQVASSAASADFYSTSFSDVACAPGDLFELDATGNETPPARDIRLELDFERT